MTRTADRPGFAPGPLRLPGADECEVWRAPVIAGRWEPFDLLDAAETARYQRFRRPADQARYVTAHTVVRLLLGGYLDRAPDGLRFDRTCTHCGADHGKPRLVTESADTASASTVDFSISHAGDRVLIAIARRQVGVDVEQTDRSTDIEALSGTVLAPAERAHFDTLPSDERVTAFYTYWTRKEAALKATAHGLAVPMSALTTTPPGEPAKLLSWTAKKPQPAPIQLHDLTPEPGYLSAVAALGESPLQVTERPVPNPS